MATCRADFFRRYLQAPEGRPKLGVGASPGAPGGPAAVDRGAMFGSRWRKPPRRLHCAAATWSSDGGEEFSSQEEATQKPEFPNVESLSLENAMESLPPEILLRILSYLDIFSLTCIAQVNKLFHRLANDDGIWFRIYQSEFRRPTWRLEEEEDDEERSAAHWKKVYFRMVAAHVYKWRKELNAVSPYTGLPSQTEHALRSHRLSWELRLRDACGRESRHRRNRAVFSETSLIVGWSDGGLPAQRSIRSLQLHAIRNPGHPILGWSSLLLDLDVGAAPSHFLGESRLVTLRDLPHGVVVGTWRGNDGVAFILISLHFHRLVERSLLGSPTCPYSEPPASPLADPSDLQLGLHGHTLHFVLHNTDACIMSQYFHQLSCRPAWIRDGLVRLTAVSRTNVSQHRSLSGGVRMPWKKGELSGSVKNCCFMTLTLTDQFQQPFWCESAAMCITPDGGGGGFLMTHSSAHGTVRVELEWLKEQRPFFLVGLVVSVSVHKVNRHFGTEY